MNEYRIHIISLDDDGERRGSLLPKLIERELSPLVVSAVDGRKLTALQYFKGSKNSNFWFNRRMHLTPSELGCFLSHKLSYEMFLRSSSEWLVVLEDDVVLLDSFFDFIGLDDSGLDKESVYILGGQEGLKSFNRVLLSPFNKYFARKVLLSTHRWIYRTCGYAIHRSRVESILALLDSETFVIDNWSYIVGNTNIEAVRYRGDIAHPLDLAGSRIECERNI